MDLPLEVGVERQYRIAEGLHGGAVAHRTSADGESLSSCGGRPVKRARLVSTPAGGEGT
jgi:hypothetical protein